MWNWEVYQRLPQTLDATVMGCFCEKRANLGRDRHLEGVYAPGNGLVLSRANPQAAYAVTGILPAGMNTWTAPMKNFDERGDPAPK